MTTSTLKRIALPLAGALALSLALGTLPPAHAADSATPHSDGVGAAISDTGITAQVKAKMLGNDTFKGSDISVTTTNGVVTLTGSAASMNARSEAARMAKAVDGVKSVDNQLVTSGGSHNTQVAKADIQKTERVGSDAWITTKVKSTLIADDVGRGLKLNVTTKNGVVNLDGTVPNMDARDHVKDLASHIDGVKSVNTAELRVQSTASSKPY